MYHLLTGDATAPNDKIARAVDERYIEWLSNDKEAFDDLRGVWKRPDLFDKYFDAVVAVLESTGQAAAESRRDETKGTSYLPLLP